MAYEWGIHGALRSPHEKHVAVCHALWPLPMAITLLHYPAQKKGASPINTAALFTDEEENLKPEQMNVMYVSIMDLLGNPGNPLYAEPHSMAEHFDAMTAGTHAIGDQPGRMHCRDEDVTTCVYEDEAKQVCEKILRYLDMRVMDGDLVMLTCLWMPTLILPI